MKKYQCVCVFNHSKKLIDHIQHNNISASGQNEIYNSGCTYQFLCDITQCEEVQPTGHNTIEVTLTNRQKVKSTHIMVLTCKHLLMAARTCHILPQLKNKIFLTIGKFCNAGLLAVFSATTFYVYNAKIVHLRG